MNRNAWWWRSKDRSVKCRLKSRIVLLLGQIDKIRHVFKKAGIGSEIGSSSRRNVRILIFVIAEIFKIHLSITSRIVVVIRIIGSVAWRST
jgi:hypothetical protein